MRVSSGRPSCSPSFTSWSIAARKAAKALPEPVGAATNTCCPACSAGHARSCAGVGASKVRENQAATAGWNESRAFMAWRQQGAPSITPYANRRHEIAIEGGAAPGERVYRANTMPALHPRRGRLLCLGDLLQVVQSPLVDPADGVERRFVVFIIGGIVADVLAL